MCARCPLLLILLAGSATAPALGQSVSPASVASAVRGPRTIPYHARDVVALRAKVRYTTMIVLPEGEDILEVTCGDKEFWIVNAHGAVAYVKPAKPGSDTNLNLLTASGQVYAFVLSEISEIGPEGGEGPREVAQHVGDLTLGCALVHVMVPSPNVGKRDLHAKI